MADESIGRDPAEQEYMDAVANFIDLEQAHHDIDQRLNEAEQRIASASGAVRETFGSDLLAAVRHEQGLVRASLDENELADTREGKAVIEATEKVIQVEEAVVAGVPRKKAMLAVMLGQDPRKPIEQSLGQLRGPGGDLEF
jgi:hypothetical protein